MRSGRPVAHAIRKLLDEQGNFVSRCDANLIKANIESEYRKQLQEQENLLGSRVKEET